MKVSDALTWLAEVILDRVVALAWRQTVGDYGHPVNADGVPGDDAFAVVGYGKFGGLELGWGSDLDLVFLHDLPPQGTTDGERAVANAQFLARLGQRINHLLATRTHTGALYEVDLRLRPSGGAGVLVSSLEAFAGYQRDDAWTWEHQALVRARAVVGAPRMREAFDAIRREVLGRERDREALREEIVAMRSRMLSELAGLKERPDAETLAGRTELDLKQAPGAVVDIEFMVQFRVLGWGRAHPELLLHTDAIRTLETARDLGLVSPDEADLLIESYKEFRAEAHRCALDAQGARTRRADLIERANRIAALWMRRMEAPGSG
jgi:glutamate-ammonia-ligase adenylyltransferase